MYSCHCVSLGLRARGVYPVRTGRLLVQYAVGSKGPETNPSDNVPPPLGPPSDIIKSLTHTLIPTSNGQTDIPLQDNAIKAQVLLSCERTFRRAIPDNKLGSILTVNDLIKFYNKPPPNTNPYAVFPCVDKTRSAGELPPNLSFPKVTSESSPTPKRTRVPFQNYDSPKHSKFLNKQQKEAQKKKRRHLTAWK